MFVWACGRVVHALRQLAGQGAQGVKEPESLGKGVTCLYMVYGMVAHTLRQLAGQTQEVYAGVLIIYTLVKH